MARQKCIKALLNKEMQEFSARKLIIYKESSHERQDR